MSSTPWAIALLSGLAVDLLLLLVEGAFPSTLGRHLPLTTKRIGQFGLCVGASTFAAMLYELTSLILR